MKLGISVSTLVQGRNQPLDGFFVYAFFEWIAEGVGWVVGGWPRFLHRSLVDELNLILSQYCLDGLIGHMAIHETHFLGVRKFGED